MRGSFGLGFFHFGQDQKIPADLKSRDGDRRFRNP